MNKTQNIKRISPAVIAICAIFILSVLVLGGVLLAQQFKDIGSTSEQYKQEHYEWEKSDVQIATESGYPVQERIVKLKDGRKVTCINWQVYRGGGPSCDWENAK